ncbi:MAG: lactonase family protein [Faecousia sp.]
MENQKLYAYVSSWEPHGGAPGLGLYETDPNTGVLRFVEMLNTADSLNGSCVDAENKKLYVNNEIQVDMDSLSVSGRIFTYDLDPKTGKAREASRLVTHCPNPAFVTLDPTGNYLFEAHHSRGISVIRHQRNAAGKLEEVPSFGEASVQVYALNDSKYPETLVECVDHADYPAGVDAHPHCAVFSPSGKLIAVADKGTGHLYLYTFDYDSQRLTLKNKVVTDEPGASPRYALFHPTKPYLYVNHEASLDGSCYISCYQYEENGGLKQIGKINALQNPETVSIHGKLEQQGFVMTPDGSCVYTLISGANVVSVMKINQETGTLQVVQNVPVQGVHPRAMAMYPDGGFLMTGCLVSGDLATYRIREDGTLERAFSGLSQKGASYISFYRPKDPA